MPVAGMSICTYPGCNTLVLKGRCRRHPYPRKPDSRSYQKRYSKGWPELRATVLRERPLCEYQKKCDGAPATEVDHADNDPNNNHLDNLVPCCKPCHSFKTARQDMRRDEQGRWTHAEQGRGGVNS